MLLVVAVVVVDDDVVSSPGRTNSSIFDICKSAAFLHACSAILTRMVMTSFFLYVSVVTVVAVSGKLLDAVVAEGDADSAFNDENNDDGSDLSDCDRV